MDTRYYRVKNVWIQVIKIQKKRMELFVHYYTVKMNLLGVFFTPQLYSSYNLCESNNCNSIELKKIRFNHNNLTNRNLYFLTKANNSSDCNWTRTHNHLVHKRAISHLAKPAKWLSGIVNTYLYGAFDCMFLSCHVRVSEWIHTLWLPGCQGTPCSKQARNLKFNAFQSESALYSCLNVKNIQSNAQSNAP